MGRPMTNDFVVDTISHCFFCLIEILPKFKAEAQSSVQSSTYSLRYLSRYLKIQMRKVFSENEHAHIPEHLLDMVERSTLKVSLCEQCARWNAKLSELCRELEKIEVEAASYLELIHGQGLKAQQNGRAEVFHKLGDSNSVDRLTTKLKLEVAEAIRGETMQKCSLKLRTVQPNIKVENMTQKKILSKMGTRRNSQRNHHKKNTEHLPTSNQIDDMKIEHHNETLNNNNDFADLGEPNGDFEPPHFPEEIETSSGTGLNVPKPSLEYQKYSSKSVQTSNYRKHIRKLPTGKLGCDLCSKEFASDGAFYNHYNGVHRKIRFQCKICNQMFTRKMHLLRHQRNVHLKK